MRPIILTAIFGVAGVALTTEVLAIVTSFQTMHHVVVVASYSGWL